MIGRAACVGLGLLVVAAAAAAWDVGVTTQSGQWTIYNRTANASRLGFPLAAGDLNGDGRDDLVLTPMNADSGPDKERGSAGEAVIVLSAGVIAGERDLALLTPPALPADTTIIYGADLVDNFGTELSTADLDRDGYVDAVIGTQYGDGADNARPESGEVVIVWGGPSIGGQVIDLRAPPPGAVTFVYGAETGDRLGVWTGITDFDGDGNPDAILGADLGDGPDNTRTNAGETYVLYGGPGLRGRDAIDLADPGTPVTVIYGIDPRDQSGATVRGADVDRDGIGDILIGAGLNRLSAQSDSVGGLNGHGFAGGDGPNNVCDPVGLACEIGEAYILFGVRGARPATIDLATPPPDFTVIYGINRGDAWGEELYAGDFDGDGRGDVAIGALVADGPPGMPRQSAGQVALIRGDAQRLRGEVIELANPPANVTMIYGARPSAIAGDTVLFLDLDGDGRDELVVASPQDRAGTGAARVSAGRVIVLFGNETPPPVIDLASVPDELPHLWIDGAHGGDLLAYSMSLGDVNGDGLRDLILNAMGADGFNDLLPLAGDCYVLDAVTLTIAAGRDVVPTRTPTTEPTATATPSATPTVTPEARCAGDCNGDGTVAISELVTAVGIALGNAPVTTCPAADGNGNGEVAINELIAAVTAALNGCPSAG